MRFVALALETAGDLDAMRAFYVRALGLPLLASGPAGFSVGVGATRLSFSRAEAPSGGEGPIYHLAFHVPENRIADARAWLAERAPLLGEPGREVFAYPAWDAESIYFADPAGNVLELIARHRLPTASEAPFGPESLLGLSEVGFPCPDLAAARAWLEATLGAREWWGLGDRFSAVGDEEGLFIVVPEGHAWVPTDRPARRAPWRLTLAGAGATHRFEAGPYEIGHER